MSHRFHPDPSRGDEAGAILWDQCEDCAARALHPETLDPYNLRAAWRKMVEVESEGGSYRSTAEAFLGRSLYRMALIMARVTGRRDWREFETMRADVEHEIALEAVWPDLVAESEAEWLRDGSE